MYFTCLVPKITNINVKILINLIDNHFNLRNYSNN